MNPIAVVAAGMITGVGLDAPSSCAAIRCSIDNFQETRFVDRKREWIVGSEVPLDPPVRGRAKLIRMAASAIRECLDALVGTPQNNIPLLVCVAEKGRQGRFDGQEKSLVGDISQELNVAFSERSNVIENGAVGGMQAIDAALGLINDSLAPFVLVVGVDTLLVARTLLELDRNHRLLTPNNSDGLIPGEAAAAVLLGPASAKPKCREFVLRGVGYGHEQASITSDEPLKADGLAEAIRNALKNAKCTYDDVDYRITDISGEQYAFKEATLAAARTMKKVKEEYDIWHPAECIGDSGAAIVPCMIGIAKTAAEKAYARGDGVLIHCSNDDEQRAVLIARYLDPEHTSGQ